MSKAIKLFLLGVANSFNTNGYYNVVTPPKNLGKIADRIHSKRKEEYSKITKVTNAKAKKAANY